MRTFTQQTTASYQDFPSFPDQLEAIISNIECRLLDTLTPAQFQMVQHLIEATQLLSELDSAGVNDFATERKSA
jgi:hypothetical protein